MCGILGSITFNSEIINPLRLSLLNHRGPDGSGEWYNDEHTVYLGHTRLAILDLSPAGQQPMHDSSKRFTITFNGEIYNHLELRQTLPTVQWRGHSDTETLVELLAHFGLKALTRVKGMFAFALHDAADDSVLLIRDRLGIKPLWYKKNDKSISFASEVKALSIHTDYIPSVKALSEYIGFGRMPSSTEVFKGVYSVQPGGWVKILQSGTIEHGQWWSDFPLNLPTVQSKKAYIQRVNQLVTKSIEEHLISDVGIGAFLSGGIDSSIVALVAGRALGQKLRTFTVGFPQEAYDERSIARQVAKRAGSEHCELEISKEECLKWTIEAVNHFDLPSVDAINTFIVSKAVRDANLKVALSGLGGDELFGGYASFRDVPLLMWLNAFPTSLTKRIIRLLPQKIKEKIDSLNNYSITELTIARRRLTSVKSLKRMGLEQGSPLILAPPNNLDTMALISWAEIQGYMIPMLLRDSDQMSMAVGLEIRVPFLDHQLVEEVLSIPQVYKKGGGVKSLLVAAFQDDLPKLVYKRRKQGFNLPMDEWIRGPLFDFTNKGIVYAADLLSTNEPLQQMKLFENRILHWTRLWNWAVLGHWLSNQKAAHDVQYTIK